MALRRSPYTSRILFTWRSRKPSFATSYATIWQNVLLWRSAPCFICTRREMTDSGATTHAMRRPGASVLLSVER